MNTERVRADFDEIASIADLGASGTDRYDSFLLSLVPANAVDILEIGCGLGRLTAALAKDSRKILGVDLSSAMIERARLTEGSQGVLFVCGDFLHLKLNRSAFDCIVSAATLHHMPADEAVPRMSALLRPGGRLIIQDIRRDTGMVETLRAYAALAQVALDRLARTGRPRSPRAVREAWARHGAGEIYLSLEEAQVLANRFLPGARVFNHWLWRYTIVWDKPGAA